jgi:hypothetical protein
MAAIVTPAVSGGSPNELVLRAAIAAYLGRYRGQTRLHSESDLRAFLRWCTEQELDPLATVRMDIERYLRWLQDERHYQPSTVSRRLSIVVGFYRVCVIDQILSHSPADYVRRPTVPAESPTLGLGHLQFEAMITTARLSANPNDFALIAFLGLLGLRIFETCAASISDLGEEHGTACCGCGARAAKSSSSRCRPRWPEQSNAPSTDELMDRSCAAHSALGWTVTPRPADSSTWPPPPACGCRGCTRTCCARS